VGATAIGFFLGVLPLIPESHPVPLEPVAIALSLFVLDATTTLVRRIVRGQRWTTPHRTHPYQRPVAQGLTHGAVLLTASAQACSSWPDVP
jgi:Fuc2NAc and GlcNAc transferase